MSSVSKDFGNVVVKNYDTNKLAEFITQHMDSQGYSVKGCDVCSVKEGAISPSQEEVFFKFVHWKVPSMESAPLFRINFVRYEFQVEQARLRLDEIKYKLNKSERKLEKLNVKLYEANKAVTEMKDYRKKLKDEKKLLVDNVFTAIVTAEQKARYDKELASDNWKKYIK